MRLASYVIVAALSALLAAPSIAQTTSPSPSSGRPSAAGNIARMQSQGDLVDINSASAAELDKLPGIGAARSQAIIANRPYKGKDELAQRKIVPQNVYDQIKDKIVARQGSSTSGSSSPSSTGTKTK